MNFFKRFLIVSFISFLVGGQSYGQDFRVIIVQPKNISGDSQIDWLSNTFSKSMQLEIRKERVKVDIVDNIPSSIGSNEFVVVSSFKKSKDRIIFFMNILRKGETPIKNSDDIGVIESLTIAFIPDIIYEIKTYVSRLARLYIASVAKIQTTKFNPVPYKFSQEKIVGLNELIGRIPTRGTAPPYDKIIFDPAEQDGWLVAGLEKMRKGEISDGLSYISRYIMKKAPEFATEDDVLNNENIKRAMDLLKIVLPSDSKGRAEAIRLFVISQFYGDFSDNEVNNLSEAINRDKFFWIAMRKLGDIYFAKGDYRSSLTYFRDYISTTNEGLGFITILSKPISLVEELSRGF
ncbi:MAG: hypothetical protein NZ927_06000 [Candidatus Calescibacterium sp.]|nr:hypothetical protein [Candidatus Calescibacterium sp.]MCX7734913.1 hypothetical protein [bacterium]MDW8087767.1 hypothetical protein [Candidatus Calescibacterium sp.]